MKTSAPAFILAGALACGSCLATSIGLGTIEQPVNLCAESDPSRIPLGAVATESNYHYGRGYVISTPRPSLHGAMEWPGGSELDQNLSSVFGIEVDNHDVPYTPAAIRLKDRTAPPYSPYSKEQVLAATLHCLLRSNQGTPSKPIQIVITADSPDEQDLAAKYSGDYITTRDKPTDEPIEPTPVSGTRLETDDKGITWVVFTGIESNTQARPPVFIPFPLGGEFGPDEPFWQLLPVWTGSRHTPASSLETLGQPYPLFYDCFNPSTGDGPETNALFKGAPHGIHRFDVSINDTGTKAQFSFPDTSTETLSASILTLVLSTEPTAEQPLTVILETHPTTPALWFEDFSKSPDWKADESTPENQVKRSCTFVWDPHTAALTQGSVPAAKIVRELNRSIHIEFVPSKAPEDESTEPIDSLPK